jgi:O-antigen ligase
MQPPKHYAPTPPVGPLIIALGSLIALVLALILPLIPAAVNDSISLLYLLFAASIIPFLGVILFLPRWRAAAAIALIFILPGPIDNLLGRVSIGYSPEAGLRIVSLLDLVFLTVIALRWPVLKARRMLSPTLLVLIALMAVTALLSMASAHARLPDYRSAAVLTGIFPLRLLLVYFFVSSSVHAPDDLRRMLVGVLVGALGLLANAAYFSFTNNTPRLTAGVFGNNTLGNVLAVLGLLAVGAFLNAGRWRMRYVALAIGGLCAIGIILTGTRMSVVAFGAGTIGLVLAMPIAPLRRFLLISAILVASTLILLLGGQLFSTSINRLLELPGLLVRVELFGVSEMQTRLLNWQTSFDFIRRHPWFGIGPGQWNFERIEYGLWLWIDVFDPHNGYILIASEYGLLFFGLYLVMIGYCLWAGVQAFGIAVQRRNLTLATLVLAFLAAAGAITLTEVTNAGILKLHLQLFYGVILFGLVACRRLVSELPSQHVEATPPHQAREAVGGGTAQL